MITYKLAKELKDAGFPQKGDLMWEKDIDFPIHHNYDKGCYCPKCQGEDFCIIPTLSELIDACGEKFRGLQKGMFDWLAEGEKAVESAKTPEEAVAKLWLKLKVGK